ncbi:MAG: sugar-binding domain-containing protein [Chloroflexota bacterium]
MQPLTARRVALVFAVALLLPACAPAPRPGSLPPTLTVDDVGGALVAMQNGIPVPTFDRQPAREMSLDGPWRAETTAMDSDLSLTDRDVSLQQIEAAGGGRHTTEYDDSSWGTTAVPGSLNPPPEREEIGGWYRRTFSVSAGWEGSVATLKFGAVNYLADVWINGSWIGYHEGGYTPFAFDISSLLVAGERNVIAVRVDNPPWGTRNDIVPWGLADWWNYGGITRSVWIESSGPLQVARADVVPHLDGFDVSATVRQVETVVGAPPPGPVRPINQLGKRAGSVPSVPTIRFELYPAEVTPQNLVAPDARALVPDSARPLATTEVSIDGFDPSGVAVVDANFLLGGADLWSPARPALYVLRAVPLDASSGDAGLWTSFGLRRVSVDPDHGTLLLNGQATMLNGVALHDELLEPGSVEAATGAHRIHQPEQLLRQLDQARTVNADLIRSSHTPANPMLLTLADRLGFAIWEEIPLYHYTPLTFGIAMQRGIAPQMLREMALRDMNRPSVLFHGLANESTGTDERLAALAELHDVDHAIDGTRLTGQAAYGSQPDDPTQAPLDVAGFTFYYGVFYGRDAASGTAHALDVARATNPEKPILALEFGRWADTAADRERQVSVFDETFGELRRRSGERPNGFVAAAVWWTLQDYATMRPNILIEQFGLFAPDGEPRSVAAAAMERFTGTSGEGADQQLQSDVRRADVATPTPGGSLLLLRMLGYALLVSSLIIAAMLFLLLRFGGRSIGRPGPRA